MLAQSSLPPCWSYQWTLEAPTLRVLNPVPIILQHIAASTPPEVHTSALSTVVAELYANALEHGLMGIDSSLKASPAGFHQYYQLRAERLEQLENASLAFHITFHSDRKNHQLHLTVKDSGPGFDHQSALKATPPREGYCGRGLPLIRTLANDLHYNTKGNTATVVFLSSAPA